MYDMLMVLVFAPIMTPVVITFGDCVQPDFKFSHEPVGFLSPVEASPEGLKGLQAELSGYEASADIIARNSVSTEGYLEVNLSYRVTVSSVKAARNLPNFQSLYQYSGEYYDLLRLPVQNYDGEVWERVMPDGAVPPTKEIDRQHDGGLVVSTVPLGRIGNLVFLEEAPGLYYHVNAGRKTAEECVAAVRAFRGRRA